jgi:hypothetical protein
MQRHISQTAKDISEISSFGTNNYFGHNTFSNVSDHLEEEHYLKKTRLKQHKKCKSLLHSITWNDKIPCPDKLKKF